MRTAEPDRDLGRRPDPQGLAAHPDRTGLPGAVRHPYPEDVRRPGHRPRAGRTAADSAAAAAAALGIGTGSTLYNDIEQYPSNASCRAAVLSFLSGWVERLHTRGYLAGMYSSGSSGITDVCAAYDDTRYLGLDQIWIAWWNGVADTDGARTAPTTATPTSSACTSTPGTSPRRGAA
ncbi:glycoside hydrolase domain-containing protein [Micromonospora sp. BRA006-A]|nr:glycoside hydrolase domain-containing protein [Micromonospora sp. BRA006-A]